MLAAVVCSTLCGFRGLQPVVQWLELQGTAMGHLLGFTRKPPVRQTYANVLAELDPELLETLLLEFVAQCELPDKSTAASPSTRASSPSPVTSPPPSDLSATTGVAPADVEIWDGKTLRGTRKGDHRAEQVLVRMQRALGKILSSHAIPANTNEPTVALDLVRRLLSKGKLVVADAMYCQRELCEAVVNKEADYLVTVKRNQPQLLRDIEQAFVIPEGFSPLPSSANRRSTTNRDQDGKESRPDRNARGHHDHGHR